MSPCSPNDVTLNIPSGPSGPAIPGFGTPFALKLPNISPFPDGFPEDLLDILNKLQLLIPPGALKPQLNLNFGKDIFDAIMKLLDQFMPFLMLYKFFLPVLNLIICIIEVICALMNPFALIGAINRLFSQCIPEFLNLFPIFALIIMIISLLLLIIALIEYIISQILKLIQAILRNILALQTAFQQGDAQGVLAIAQKLGAFLCMFQNLFVLLAVFNIIIDIIKDILGLAFAIPPCQSGGSGDTNSCCTPETCPAFIANAPYTNMTGTLKYFPEIGGSTTFTGGFPAFTFASRSEMWQLYDTSQTQVQQFTNIYDAFDITNVSPKPIFFPESTVFGPNSDTRQVSYLFNLRLFYNPLQWNRNDPKGPRYVRFNNVIMTTVPTTNLIQADNSTTNVSQGVAVLTGGSGFEDDGTTPLQAYGPDGVSPVSGTANLNNFIHKQSEFTSSYVAPNINDGYTFQDIQYTFSPNLAALLKQNLVNARCVPDINNNSLFIQNVLANNLGLKTQELGNLVNSSGFPDPAAAQACLTNAVSALRLNMTPLGVAAFQATCTACLDKLRADTEASIAGVIGIGADPCNSTFTLNPPLQFTTFPINIAVSLNEVNGLLLTNGLPVPTAENIAAQLKAYPTFGTASNFAYDGYQFFNASITSDQPGNGTVMVSFANQIFCTNTISATAAPTHTLQEQAYQFVYTPTSAGGLSIGEGDTSPDGKPRRDGGDVSREGDS